MASDLRGWQAVQDEVLRRIRTREWKPGDVIPNEADLALAFGCSRTTVNRALQALADSGLLYRRRKAGTRVALRPVRKATLSISLIRQEIEGLGRAYGYALLRRQRRSPPAAIKERMDITASETLLHVQALHLADDRPYVFENRWINPTAVPDIVDVDLTKQSANEWLVMHAPFTHGDIAFVASPATTREAEILRTKPASALLVIERLTWENDTAITSARLAFAPGYRMQTVI